MTPTNKPIRAFVNKKILNPLTKVRPVAILGGTFDPIHNGHLHIARQVWQAFELDHVLFMPTGSSPFKPDADPLHQQHRLAMTRLAIQDTPHYKLSELEISQTGKTYTVDSLHSLKQQPTYADRTLYFVLGPDVLERIYDFKEALALFTLCEFILVERGGYTCSPALLTQLAADGAVVHTLPMPAIELSSQWLRTVATNKQLFSDYVPTAVADYMEVHQLYHTPVTFDIPAHTAQLKSQVSPELFTHIMGVCDTAVALARHHGVDEASAHIAALLHDWCKEYSTDELLRVGAEHNYTPDTFICESMHICHGFLAAAMCPATFGITDQAIIDAVRYHTTGRANMSLLEKIVFIADATEPNRGDGADLKQLRELTYSNIDRAMHLALKFNFDKACKRGFIFHPTSLEALTYYR